MSISAPNRPPLAVKLDRPRRVMVLEVSGQIEDDSGALACPATAERAAPSRTPVGAPPTRRLSLTDGCTLRMCRVRQW